MGLVFVILYDLKDNIFYKYYFNVKHFFFLIVSQKKQASKTTDIYDAM